MMKGDAHVEGLLPGEGSAPLLREAIKKFQQQSRYIQELQFAPPEDPPSDASELEILSVRLRILVHQASFVAQVCNAKIVKVTEWLDWSIESTNVVASATGVRSLIEHVAIRFHMNHALERCLSQLKDQSSPDKVDKALSGAEKVLKRAYYGTSAKGATYERLHVMNSIDLWAKNDKIADGGPHPIGDIYAFLCEYVHPNYGSNRLVSSGELGVGGLSINAPPTELGKLPYVCYMYGILSLWSLQRENEFSPAHLMKLSDYAHRCLSPAAKPKNVFTTRPARPKGDGETPETAFTFPKARTRLEEQHMVHQYLASKGIVLGEDSVIQAIDKPQNQDWVAGPITEYWDTPQGRIYFCYRRETLPWLKAAFSDIYGVS